MQNQVYLRHYCSKATRYRGPPAPKGKEITKTSQTKYKERIRYKSKGKLSYVVMGMKMIGKWK